MSFLSLNSTLCRHMLTPEMFHLCVAILKHCRYNNNLTQYVVLWFYGSRYIYW